MTVRVTNFTIILPFTQQKNFAPSLRRNIEHHIQMTFFHHQDQIRLDDGLASKLNGFVISWGVPLLLKNKTRCRLYGAIDQRSNAG
ncbi:hypothetical protein D3C87_1153900 [compost metagenome]